MFDTWDRRMNFVTIISPSSFMNTKWYFHTASSPEASAIFMFANRVTFIISIHNIFELFWNTSTNKVVLSYLRLLRDTWFYFRFRFWTINVIYIVAYWWSVYIVFDIFYSSNSRFIFISSTFGHYKNWSWARIQPWVSLQYIQLCFNYNCIFPVGSWL